MAVTQATLDPFDAPINDTFDYCQGLPDEVRFPMYRREFSIDPLHWTRYALPLWANQLTWQEYRYSEVLKRSDLQKIISSTLPGIYIFYTRPETLIGRFPQFAFYVGISNEKNSQRPLRDRLGDYLPSNLSTIQKRKNVHRMMQLYYKSLWVTYATTSAQSSDLEALEESVHGYIHPCFGRRDYPVGIKTQQKAFGMI